MSSVIIKGDTSGQITLSAPAVAGTNTLTLPTITGTIGTLNSGTAVSASGTAVDFTSIPAGVRRITVLFNGVSASGTSPFMIQIGDSGGLETTGYTAMALRHAGASNQSNAQTTYYPLMESSLAANAYAGAIVLTNFGSNTWIISGQTGPVGGGAYVSSVVGVKTLSDTLTQLRVSTANGTDTFDAGSINIMYE